MENLQGLSPQNQNASVEEESKRKAAEDEMRRDMMATILDSAARERCAYSSLFRAQCPYSI